MTDESFNEMISRIPKVLLNEDGSLFRLTCENCGIEVGCRKNIEHFICGVCFSFKERGFID